MGRSQVPNPADRNQPHNQSQAIIQDLESQAGLTELRPMLFHLGVPLGSLKEDEIVDVIGFQENEEDQSFDLIVKSLQGKEESVHLEASEAGTMLMMVKSLVPTKDIGTRIVPVNAARTRFFNVVQELHNARRSGEVV